MQAYIYSILRKIKKSKFYNFFTAQRSRFYLKKNIKQRYNDNTIRVAFIAYEPGMWDKQAPVYNKMLLNDNFDPYIIVVPDLSISKEATQEKINFFLNNYPNTILYDENTLNKFKNHEFAYTFYQTPYNYKYPKNIQPNKLVKYSKLCFIPYAYIGAEEFFKVSSHENFFDNIYMSFMDSEPMKDLLLSKYNKTTSKRLQHIVFLGYPAFEHYIDMPAKKQIDSILWIPRWSYAEKGGGSHFLEYKDLYNDLAFQNKELNWTMRPHPLMFTTLANQGLFPPEQAEQYRKNCSNAKVSIDEHSLLSDTLNNTDLLIADYSSIIIMYFLTGRPIIYCRGNHNLSGIYRSIYEAMYIAESWEDVQKYTKQILNGDDPLKEKRKQIVTCEIEKHKNASDRIINAIYNDYFL